MVFRKSSGADPNPWRGCRTTLWWLLTVALVVVTPLVVQTPGTWEPAANMAQGRAGHTATLLPNGKVLIAGGKDARGNPLATAERYDPATGLYTPVAAPLPTPVWGHTATLLNDGAVLLAGESGVSGQPVSAAQLFDPSTSTFTALTPMSTPRSQHTATLLGDGWVLIAGGSDDAHALAALELYFPGPGPFPAPNPLLTPRQGHTATLMPDGRVLVVGGSNASGVLNSAELYAPKDDTIDQAGSLNFARTQASAALLLGGTVLAAGGQASQHKDLYSAEVYALLTNTFTLLTALMITARSGHIGLTLLHNGKVLIAGTLAPVTQSQLPKSTTPSWSVLGGRIAQHRPATV
jgi:hypothetical protein